MIVSFFFLKALEKLVGDLRPGVKELKDGKYHDVEKVEKRVESLASRLRLLGPRLKEASSAVDEAQAVVAMETSLEELEVWLVSCGKFSSNQNIVSQIEEHKVHYIWMYVYIHCIHMSMYESAGTYACMVSVFHKCSVESILVLLNLYIMVTL